MHLICVLFCVIIAAAVTATTAPNTLKMVNVVYRHGDRSPITTFPTDPNNNKWLQGPGWLTTIGMRQQYALGQFLRSEYGNILNTTYKSTEIVVKSSDESRCLMSAYCNLAGLYPPHGDQVWNPNLHWQPIPVHTRPQDEDHVLAVEEHCPRYSTLYDRELKTPTVQKVDEENRLLYDYVMENAGVDELDISNAWQISDALFCDKTHNFSLPQWAVAEWEESTVYDKLLELSEYSFSLLYNGTQLSRLKGGPLLKVFIKNMQNTTRDEQQYRMYMYSAHDSTIGAVLDALKVFDCKSPLYASALLVELHEVDTQYCVKLRYRNDSNVDPYLLVHPDCQKECCPLDEFVEVTKSRVPENWDAECGIPTPAAEGGGDNTAIIGALIGVSCALALILLVLFVLLCRNHLRRKESLSTREGNFQTLQMQGR